MVAFNCANPLLSTISATYPRGSVVMCPLSPAITCRRKGCTRRSQQGTIFSTPPNSSFVLYLTNPSIIAYSPRCQLPLATTLSSRYVYTPLLSPFNVCPPDSIDQIPIAWLVALIPHRYGKSLAKVFDPKSPRSYAQAIEKDKTIDNAVRQKPINPVEYLNIFINLLFFLRPELR